MVSAQAGVWPGELGLGPGAPGESAGWTQAAPGGGCGGGHFTGTDLVHPEWMAAYSASPKP